MSTPGWYAAGESGHPPSVNEPDTFDSQPVPTLRGTRVLMLGASGYIGTHLVESLAESGAVVRAAARRVGAQLARG